MQSLLWVLLHGQKLRRNACDGRVDGGGGGGGGGGSREDSGCEEERERERRVGE